MQERLRPLTNLHRQQGGRPPSQWSYLPPLLVGVYGADLHKLLLNAAAVALASPLAWQDVAAAADVLLAVTLAGMCGLALVRTVRLPRLAVVPGFCMVIFAGLMSVSLVMYFDDTSLLHYQRFVGGNVVLFFAALLVCNQQSKIRLVWSVWLATALLQSLIAIWYWREGYMWTSIRGSIIPGTGIRMGYQCAVALVYCIFAYRNRNVWNVSACILFAFGVLMSGSKMSLLLAVSATCGLFLFELVVAKKVTMTRLVALGAGAAAIAGTLVMIATTEKTGFHKFVLESDVYEDSLLSRLQLKDEYLELALQNPLFGCGISAAYSDAIGDDARRTHSVIQATLVQTGVVGLMSYLVFAGYLGGSGLAVLWKMRCRLGTTYYLNLVAFAAFVMLVVKAEVTGDTPANRELWMVAGLLVHSLAMLQSTTTRTPKGIGTRTTSGAGWRPIQRPAFQGLPGS